MAKSYLPVAFVLVLVLVLVSVLPIFAVPAAICLATPQFVSFLAGLVRFLTSLYVQI